MINKDMIYGAWIKDLPEEARFEVTRIATKRSYDTDEVLFRKGEDADAFYGIYTGRVRISKTTYCGGEMFATVLMPGNWFGEISVLDGEGRTHDAFALEPSEFMVLPIGKLRRLMAKHESIHSALVQLLCGKVRFAFNLVDDFLACSPKERLAKRIVHLSEISNEDGIKASQEELSQLSGISRQSASKFLKEWEAQGVIERQYGLIRILDRQSLQLTSN